MLKNMRFYLYIVCHLLLRLCVRYSQKHVSVMYDMVHFVMSAWSSQYANAQSKHVETVFSGITTF